MAQGRFCSMSDMGHASQKACFLARVATAHLDVFSKFRHRPFPARILAKEAIADPQPVGSLAKPA